MSTHILSWNSERWPWKEKGREEGKDLAEVLRSVRNGHPIYLRWSSGNTKSIPVGSRVFLLKQGPEPRGLLGSGWTTAAVEQGPHWHPASKARGERANYVWVAFDVLLDPDTEPLLDPRKFPSGPAANVHWTPQASGTSIPANAAAELEQLWAAHTVGTPAAWEVDAELSALEGERREWLVRHRAREWALREAKIQAALAKGPLRCEVPGCGFDFERTYGELGHEYAQVHHLHPLAAATEPVETGLDDLAIVCANCHAMIHRYGECRPFESITVSGREST